MSAHAFAGPGSLTVAQLLDQNRLTVDALFERLGKVWTRSADYDGRHFKAERVRTELPTEEIPAVLEPLAEPKWRTWLAVLVAVVVFVLMVVVSTALTERESFEPTAPAETLVRAPWTLPGVR